MSMSSLFVLLYFVVSMYGINHTVLLSSIVNRANNCTVLCTLGHRLNIRSCGESRADTGQEESGASRGLSQHPWIQRARAPRPRVQGEL
jgi:hypothetical protein